MGRPAKPDADKRLVRKTLTLFPHEKKRMEAAAKAADPHGAGHFSDWARELLLREADRILGPQ